MGIATDHGNAQTIAVGVAQVSFVAMTQILYFGPVDDMIGPPDWHGSRVAVVGKLVATVEPDQFGQSRSRGRAIEFSNGQG